MKKILIVIAASILIMLIFTCTSDPIIVEISSEPINPPGTGTIITAVETNVCVDRISFKREILPLVVSSCAYSGCHDAATAEEGVVLTDYQKIMKEVTPNSPNDSELYRTITLDPNDNEFMPPAPAFPMTSEQITLIRDWINQGANNTDCSLPCDSDNTSFAADIFPIIKNQCLGCHQPSNPLGDVNLEDYSHIRAFAANGQLLGTINHTLGYEAMPTENQKITDCQIAMINNWIVEGALDN